MGAYLLEVSQMDEPQTAGQRQLQEERQGMIWFMIAIFVWLVLRQKGINMGAIPGWRIGKYRV